MVDKIELFIGRTILFFQFVLLVILISGTLITTSRLRAEYNKTVALELKLNSIIQKHTDVVNLLLVAQQKGYRFTAGNSWQMVQIYEHGKVDMTKFPAELKDPSKTWFHKWLDKNNYLR